jgi:hypothetical protein
MIAMKNVCGKTVRSVLLLMLMASFMLFSRAAVNADIEDESEVTVYLTVSEDSEFVTGVDENKTVIARLPVKIGYTDLAKYGLEQYYRYEAEPFEKGGKYKEPRVLVKRPTLLMLYLKALSDYYLGREITPDDYGQKKAFQPGGSPTSFYMNSFWGHDENLMYYYNHEYPLMAPGWGATADYILLEDGDEIDVGMYTDWSFYTRGKFIFFDKTNPQIRVGEKETLRMISNGTSAAINGETVDSYKPITWENIRVSEDRGRTWKKNVWYTDDDGYFDVAFDHPGVYYISSGPHYKLQGDTEPCYAPPISVVEVSPGAIEDYMLTKTSLGRLKYSWEEVENATKYKVEYKMENESDWREKETTKTECFLTPRETGKYEFRVTAYAESDYVPAGDPVKLLGGEPSDVAKIYAEKAPDHNSEKDEIAKLTEAAKSLKVTGLKVRAKSRKFTVTWNKTKGAVGYQVQYKLKTAAKWSVLNKSVTKTSVGTKKLKKGKVYSFRVRTFANVNGGKIYGKWSAAKAVRCK